MAQIFQCDRCGKPFEERVCTTRYLIIKQNHPYEDVHIDLCDDCYLALIKWLYGENANKEVKQAKEDLTQYKKWKEKYRC